jgi:DNA replication protein DnaC
MTRDIPIPRFDEEGKFVGYVGARTVEVLEPTPVTPPLAARLEGELVALAKRPRRVRDIDPELPVCPVCGARDDAGDVLRGGAYRTDWRDLYDLEHDCDCGVKHPDAYDAGLVALWQARGRRKAFMLSVPERFHDARLTNYRQQPGNVDAYRAARALELGSSLYIHGDPGNGKTHLAVAAALRLTARGTARYQSCATLRGDVMDAIRAKGEKPDWLTPDVLILDDMDKAAPGEFVFELVFSALDMRWSRGKTTIVTANHAPGWVADRIAVIKQGDALVRDRPSANALLSRLTSGVTVEVVAPDQRIGRDGKDSHGE